MPKFPGRTVRRHGCCASKINRRASTSIRASYKRPSSTLPHENHQLPGLPKRPPAHPRHNPNPIDALPALNRRPPPTHHDASSPPNDSPPLAHAAAQLQQHGAHAREIEHEAARSRAQRDPGVPVRAVDHLQAVELRAVRAAEDPVREHGVGEERDQDAAVLAAERAPAAVVER